MNLITATDQEIFSEVWTKLNAQGRAAMDPSGQCLYRAPDGTMCAIGHLLDVYRPEFEGQGPASLAVALYSEGLINARFALLRELQNAHDRSLAQEGLETWRECMREIAETYNLSIPE